METARLENTLSEVYPINVQILKNGIYSGEGRFCTTMKEALQYVRGRGVKVIDYDIDLLMDIDEEDWDVFQEATSEHGKCIGYRQEAFHDVHTYEDGYEERTYIGD